MATQPDSQWLQALAARIAAARLERGWTQEMLADGLGISIKNVQRLESGKHDLRATTLLRVARVLQVDAGGLMPQADDLGPQMTARRTARSGPLTGLKQTGWTPTRPSTDPSGLVPVFDIRPQAGHAVPHGLPLRVGWAKPPEGRHPRAEGLMLLRVAGNSMAPRMPDGAWLLLQHPVADVRIRKDVLAYDGDTGGWLVKRIGATEADALQTRVRLDSLAAGYAPVWLTLAPEGAGLIVAEVLEVLQG